MRRMDRQLLLNKRKRDRARRIDQGICLLCPNKNNGRTKHCDDCLRYRVERNRHLRERGICRCGRNAEKGMSRCSACRRKQRNVNRRRYSDALKENPNCYYCKSNLRIPGRIGCNSCLKNNTVHYRNKRDGRTKAGLCRRCGRVRKMESSLNCMACHLKQVSTWHFSTTKLWRFLKDLLDDCGWKCPYSGRVLILGKNAELDHIVPLSRDGSRSPINVQWVDSDINLMKRDHLEEEFISLVGEIARHLKI